MSGNTDSNGSGPFMTVETAKAILNELLAAFNNPGTTTQLEEARDTAGHDMLKTMQYVFPAAADIQMDVIKNYGFSRDGKGAVQFALAVKSLAKDDAEIATLYAKLRCYFIPTMIPTQSAALATTTRDDCAT